MKQVGRIQSIDEFVRWCESKRNLLKPGIYKADYKRILLPIRYQATLDKPPQYIKAHWDERMDKIASRFCPDWKLSLLCFYEIGGGIKSHRDSSGYGENAFALSSTDYTFIHDGNKYDCQAGCIYHFNSKKLHSIPSLHWDRWALIWWEPNPKYWNNQQLSLFD